MIKLVPRLIRLAVKITAFVLHGALLGNIVFSAPSQRLASTVQAIGVTVPVVFAISFVGVILYVIWPSLLSVSGLSARTPPMSAEYLFYLFLDAQNCDALVGDLEERYKLIHKKFGVRRANFWYFTQAIRSVGPIAWLWAKKLVMKPMIGTMAWAVARGLVDHESWLAALVEFWKRIRS